MRFAPLTQFQWRSNGASQSAPLLPGAYRKKPNGFGCAVRPFPMAHQWRKWWRITPHQPLALLLTKRDRVFTLKHCGGSPPQLSVIFRLQKTEVSLRN